MKFKSLAAGAAVVAVAAGTTMVPVTANAAADELAPRAKADSANSILPKPTSSWGVNQEITNRSNALCTTWVGAGCAARAWQSNNPATGGGTEGSAAGNYLYINDTDARTRSTFLSNAGWTGEKKEAKRLYKQFVESAQVGTTVQPGTTMATLDGAVGTAKNGKKGNKIHTATVMGRYTAPVAAGTNGIAYNYVSAALSRQGNRLVMGYYFVANRVATTGPNAGEAGLQGATVGAGDIAKQTKKALKKKNEDGWVDVGQTTATTTTGGVPGIVLPDDGI